MSPATPKYVARIARLPLVFEHLAAHRDGLSMGQLAAEFDVPPEQLREDLLAFYTADVTPDLLMGLSRPGVLGFFGPDGRSADPNDAEIVRVLDARSADELGVEHVDAAELALIYTAARALLEIDQDDEDLAAAVDALAETMFGDVSSAHARPAPWNRALEPIEEAVRDHRKVRIVYSRAWDAGVRERVIEPYRLLQTGRGWEIDAGPVDERGELRTFLLANVRESEVLERDLRGAVGPAAAAGGQAGDRARAGGGAAVGALGGRHVRRERGRRRGPGAERGAGRRAVAAAAAPAGVVAAGGGGRVAGAGACGAGGCRGRAGAEVGGAPRSCVST